MSPARTQTEKSGIDEKDGASKKLTRKRGMEMRQFAQTHKTAGSGFRLQ